MQHSERAVERLNAIHALIVQARDIADLAGEHLLGAKLDDCAERVAERLAAVDR